VIDQISQLNRGAKPMGSYGLVVGATIGRSGHDLSRVGGPFLAPGLGAQGGSPDDLRAIFSGNLDSVLPTYSREVLGNGPDTTKLRDAARRVLEQCRVALTPTSG
jgi:orotidine-5'-phosphate decarboxylase